MELVIDSGEIVDALLICSVEAEAVAIASDVLLPTVPVRLSVPPLAVTVSAVESGMPTVPEPVILVPAETVPAPLIVPPASVMPDVSVSVSPLAMVIVPAETVCGPLIVTLLLIARV